MEEKKKLGKEYTGKPVYIYLFNEHNQPQGAFRYLRPVAYFVDDNANIIEGEYTNPDNPNVDNSFFKTSISVDSNGEPEFGENINSQVILTLERITDVKVIQNRVIYNKKKICIYVKAKIINPKNSIDTKLEPFFVRDESIDVLKDKIYKKFEKKVKKQITKEKIAATWKFAVLSFFSLLIFALSIFLEIYKIFIEKIEGKKYSSFNWWIGIFTLLLFVITSLIALVKTIQSMIKSKTEIDNLYNGSLLLQTTKKTQIIESIKSNRTNSYPLKDFKCYNFPCNEKDDSDWFMFSDNQNKNLHDFAETMKITKSKNKVYENNDSKIAKIQVISDKIKAYKILYNDKLLGIDTDLSFYKGKEIPLKKVSYYQYVTNDELIYRNITVSYNPRYYLDGAKYCLNPENNGFRDITSSPFTNLLGINIIVILNTGKEKYVVINRQCTFSDVNHNKHMPSGSGSIDYKDYKIINKKNGTFYELLKYAALRELSEESYIDNDFINCHNPQFNVLGCARLFSKAGKPDFFTSLELQVTEQEIEGILLNYNEVQYDTFATKKEKKYLESTYMIIKPYNQFLSLDNNLNPTYLYEESPQLRYTKYLLNYYDKLEKNA